MGDEQQQALHRVLGGSAMRAPTWVEKMNDAVRDVYEQAAKQPAIRILDMLGLSDIAGVADEMNRPNTGLKMGIMPEGPGKGIKAFHGSPHDFEKFDLSKIGTGEGAQAYGHGLYFAQDENVARSYRDTLSQRGPDMYSNAHYNAQQVVARMNGDPQWAAEAIRDQMTGLPESDATYRRLADTLEFIESGRYKAPLSNPGRMYEVQIHADPEDFLDWDKPLSQQSEKVRNGFGATIVKNPAPAFADERWVVQRGDQVLNAFPTRKAAEAAPMSQLLPKGEWQKSIGGPRVSKELADAGIPGIKYLDQGSRSSGDGTRNYVVFDDKLISIVKKYGIAAALGAGLISQVQAEQMKAQGLQ